jgi:D-serine dehydratase
VISTEGGDRFTYTAMNQPAALVHAPCYVGGYQIGGKYGLRINFASKPNIIHRTFMRVLLGWEWVDA